MLLCLQIPVETGFNQLFSLFRELSRFIAAGRLHCKIDKVNEIVETNRYVTIPRAWFFILYDDIYSRNV